MTTDERFERDRKRADRVVRFWQVYGESYRGRIVKRDGKPVHCGHQHRTEAACGKCVERMRRERPGKCQTYRPCKIVALVFKREPVGVK